MIDMKSILVRSLLALAVATSSAVALANPVYHVTIDTTQLGNGTAYLDLTFGSLGTALPGSATLTGFSSDFGTTVDQEGDSSGSVAGGTVVLGNADGYNDLYQSIALGGLFNFDVSFSVGDSGAGSRFAASLYNGDQTDYLVQPANLVQIDLVPGSADYVAPANDYASVSAVPEPSTLLSMVTGLGLLGFGLRRRAR